MKYLKMLGVCAIFAALTASGCDDKKTGGENPAERTSGTKRTPKPHTHGKGPNGGVVFDLGKYHAEFTVNHDGKECTILFIAGEDKDAEPLTVAARELTLLTKETKTKEGKTVAPMTIKMLPKDEKDGKASKYVGTDPGLGNVADFEGTVTGTIDGKPATGEFKE